jgi:hypothetical protein
MACLRRASQPVDRVAEGASVQGDSRLVTARAACTLCDVNVRLAVSFAVLLAVAALARESRAAAAAPLAEIVTGEVDEHELHLHLRSTLREPIVATRAVPTMPPFFAKAEVEAALAAYGPYVLEHVHVQDRAKPLAGKVVAARPLDPLDGPLNQATDLEKHFAEVDVVYTLTSQDPLVLSFDLLADREAAPGVPLRTIYSVDVKGRKKWHAELETGASTTLDIAEPGSVGRSEGIDSGPARRRRTASTIGFTGVAILVALATIGYSILQRVRRR